MLVKTSSILLLVTIALSSCSSWKAADASAPARPKSTEAVIGKVEYPQELRGAWMPAGLGCPATINPDSESLLLIEAGILGQYENTSKPLRVEKIQQHPAMWRIHSTYSPGTGEYEGEGDETFLLDGRSLAIGNERATVTYVRCK